MTAPVRVRFAPSPTGYLHVGGARSALFNYLYAKNTGGTFILRIEDTDQSRFVEGALTEIYDSLHWLGLDWDEGPEVGGEYGPYIQSQRTDLYKKYAQELLDKGHAYRCFCTSERLSALRVQQEKEKSPLGYDRKCRELTADQVQELIDKGTPYVIRFMIPRGRTVAFTDRIRGNIEYQSDLLDDLVLIKTDGFPTYHMANVVDDHCMKISHVLRGDEWITSTPRHVLIYEAFGWDPPVFAHLPVILSPDGGKLSKRKGAASVMDYKVGGYLPEALFNFLALLGWAPGDDREKMTREEMVQAFSLDKVSPKSSVLDETKLEWMNGVYLAERSAMSLLSDIRPEYVKKGWISETDNGNDEYALKVIDLLKVRSKKLTELVEQSAYFFVEPSAYEEKAAKKNFTAESVVIMESLVSVMQDLQSFDQAAIENAFREFSEKNNIPAGKLIHPTRLAVSGVSFGPGLFELLQTLGKDTVISRMKKGINHIKTMTGM